ncbi:MAG: hypothetical protein M3R25_03270 [Bacteroidota bacterium]|nr:hypothetical protein [Bacteroidota bacterium]
MKTPITIWTIIILAMSWSPVTSQKILQQGNQWIFEEMDWNLLQGFTDTFFVTITVEEDTLINGLTYSKVIYSNVPPCWNVRSTEYLRGDGSKIYRRSRDNQQDFLMLDFDETVGYTMLFDGSYNPLDTSFVQIDSIGPYVTGGGDIIEVQYTKVINNQAYGDESPYLIAKDIGFISLGILFPELGIGLCDFHDPTELRCAVIDGDTTHFTHYDCFELTNSVIPIEVATYSFQPNPVSDYLQIPEGMKYLEMVSLTGHVIYPMVENGRLYFNDISPGYYVVRMISILDNRVVAGRVVKL